MYQLVNVRVVHKGLSEPDRFTSRFTSLLHQGLSEPEFYGDLVYKFKKIMGRTDFSDQFRIIIICQKRIGYDLNKVIYPIMVDNYGSLLPVWVSEFR